MPATTTDILIGKCVACRKTCRHDGPRSEAPWCDCRATVPCVKPFCTGGAGDDKPGDGHVHPITFINWRPLVAVHNPSKACNWQCLAATNDKCSCSCGGANHAHRHLLEG